MATVDLGVFRHRFAIGMPLFTGALAVMLAAFAFAANHYGDVVLFLVVAATMACMAISKQHASR